MERLGELLFPGDEATEDVRLERLALLDKIAQNGALCEAVEGVFR